VCICEAEDGRICTTSSLESFSVRDNFGDLVADVIIAKIDVRDRLYRLELE
jgi:hypothetical protein